MELNRVFEYNLEHRGVEWAVRYVSYLENRIAGLGREYLTGKQVHETEDLRYLVMKRRARGDGHLAIYEVGRTEVSVLRIFHTKQDWRNLL